MQPTNDRLDAFARHFAIAEEAISRALRTQFRRRSGDLRLTPAQAAILKELRGLSQGLRLSVVAHRLGVSAASASDSVSSLVEKHLVRRSAASDDGRAVALRLTSEGEKVAETLAQDAGALSEATQGLSETEKTVLLRALMKVVRRLELEKRVSETPMCVSCRSFRPFVNETTPLPHECDYFDVAFDDSGLRFECEGYHRAGDELATALWRRFSTHGEAPPAPLAPLEDDL